MKISIFRRVKNSCALHRTFNVEPIYLQHENSGEFHYDMTNEELIPQLTQFNAQFSAKINIFKLFCVESSHFHTNIPRNAYLLSVSSTQVWLLITWQVIWSSASQQHQKFDWNRQPKSIAHFVSHFHVSMAELNCYENKCNSTLHFVSRNPYRDIFLSFFPSLCLFPVFFSFFWSSIGKFHWANGFGR